MAYNEKMYVKLHCAQGKNKEKDEFRYSLLLFRNEDSKETVQSKSHTKDKTINKYLV